jgi:hypothetical protein
MQARSYFGITITLIGILITIYTAYLYVVTDDGLTTTINEIPKAATSFNWSPIVGTVFLVCGVIIIKKGKRNV